MKPGSTREETYPTSAVPAEFSKCSRFQVGLFEQTWFTCLETRGHKSHFGVDSSPSQRKCHHRPEQVLPPSGWQDFCRSFSKVLVQVESPFCIFSPHIPHLSWLRSVVIECFLVLPFYSLFQEVTPAGFSVRSFLLKYRGVINKRITCTEPLSCYRDRKSEGSCKIPQMRQQETVA